MNTHAGMTNAPGPDPVDRPRPGREPGGGDLVPGQRVVVPAS